MLRIENLRCLHAVSAFTPHFGPKVKTIKNEKIFNILAKHVLVFIGKSFYMYNKGSLVFYVKLNISVMQLHRHSNKRFIINFEG